MKSRKQKHKTPKYLIPALLLVAVLGVGSSLALFTDTEAAINKVKIGSVSGETTEKIHGLTKEDIGVTVNGTVPCYVRMRVEIPKLEGLNDTNVIIKNRTHDSVLFSNWTPPTLPTDNGKQWEYSDDGYWYYPGTVKAEENAPATVYLLDEISYKFNFTDQPEAGEIVVDEKDGVYTFTQDGQVINVVTEDQLGIVLYSEFVQSDNIELPAGTDPESADAAIAAFEALN